MKSTADTSIKYGPHLIESTAPEFGPAEFIDLTWESDRRYFTRCGDEKVPCEQCGKLVGGLRQHRKDVHGSPKRLRMNSGTVK